MTTIEAPRERITATIGPDLRCRGWRQESILRMLENNLENAENQDELIVYAGAAKAARDWQSYHRIVAALKVLADDETMVVQSGKPIGVFKTWQTAPRVLEAAGNFAPDWIKSRQHHYELLDKKLTIVPGMTAAAWQYIGSQGIIQGTYESFMAAARQSLGGSLRGKTILTAGSGGMGGAQALAGKLAEAALLIADVSEARLQRRIDEGYLQGIAGSVREGIEAWLDAAEMGTAASIGVVANVVDVMEALLARDVIPDIVTDQTTTDPRNGYYPRGVAPEETDRLRKEDPDQLIALSNATLIEHMRYMLEFQRRGAVCFEYGNGLRRRAAALGVTDAFEVDSFMTKFIRPYFCEAIGPFRWMAIDGQPETIYRIDAMLLEMFKTVPRVTNWLGLAKQIKFTGLPARICWLGYGERPKAALEVNAMIARGDIQGPVAFTRDHLDAGGASIPFRETENMRDGSDGITDWSILNALLNASSGADLIAYHSSQSAGVTLVADGTELAAERISRVLNSDTGLGVLRYADAGYDIALAARERFALGIDNYLAAQG